VTIAPENLPEDNAALKRIIADMASEVPAAQAEIAKIKFQLARYRRAEFGGSSEKLAREAEPLELAIEALAEDQDERIAALPDLAAIGAIIPRRDARSPS
jgi:transposase